MIPQGPRQIIEEVKKAVIGKDDIVFKAMLAILAKGHILIEDIPGVGKTTLALAFSRAMELQCKRVQFTPDVMPSDVTGFTVYNRQTGAWEYKEGAAMCNLLLADEINRTSSKTQSALLEVMEEGRVTVDGVTYPVPAPFIVMATQNPVGSAGTQLLPESQLDRFMICLTIGYPALQDEIGILKSRHLSNPLDQVWEVADGRAVLEMQEEVQQVYAADEMYEYIASLTAATRRDQRVRLGVSPRGSLAVAKMAKANAYLDGRDYMIPDDVKEVFCDVCAHRLVLSTQAKIENVLPGELLGNLMKTVRAPSVLKGRKTS